MYLKINLHLIGVATSRPDIFRNMPFAGSFQFAKIVQIESKKTKFT